MGATWLSYFIVLLFCYCFCLLLKKKNDLHRTLTEACIERARFQKSSNISLIASFFCHVKLVVTGKRSKIKIKILKFVVRIHLLLIQ